MRVLHNRLVYAVMTSQDIATAAEPPARWVSVLLASIYTL